MGGVNAVELEKVFPRIGEAALDPTVWPQIMEAICSAACASGAALLQSDVRTPDIPRTASVNDLIRHYFQHNLHLRDRRAVGAVPLLLAGAPVVTDQDILTPDEMRRDAFYAEALLPFGLQWFAVVGFRAGRALWGLSIQRTPRELPFEEQQKRILAVLSQRLTEVASLSTAVGRIALVSATNALNAVRQPAIAIDRFGFVLDANPAAEALFDQHIRIKDGRLVVGDASARSCLEKLIDRVRITPDTETLPCDPIVIRRQEKTSVIARILPVHGAARTPFLAARVILTLIPVEHKPRPKVDLLAKAFGLTPAEARLASIIAEGVSPEHAAEELGIARVTARNQLRAIFSKTATHRQGELVALLSRL